MSTGPAWQPAGGGQRLLLSVSNPDQTCRPHGPGIRLPGGQGQRAGQQGLETGEVLRVNRLESRNPWPGLAWPGFLCDLGWVSPPLWALVFLISAHSAYGGLEKLCRLGQTDLVGRKAGGIQELFFLNAQGFRAWKNASLFESLLGISPWSVYFT